MRYCRFMSTKGPQYGAIEIRDGVACIVRLLQAPAEDPMCQPQTAEYHATPVSEAHLLAPVHPRKIVCVGRNYREHASELGNDVPTEPLIFFKPPTSIIGPGDEIVHPQQTQRRDFEGELGIVIGKTCRHLADDAQVRDYIRGYTVVNDVTARDLQKKDSQWARAKGFDTFCPVGPIVTDEIDPVTGVDVITQLNGEEKQHGNTRDFIFSIAEMIRYISSVMTLEAGDLIATGTPAGVSAMKPGDIVEVSIHGIGTLRNTVADN
ncbi:MAG: fumarylacetoacetate hydrolase family protein [Acidobacteriaceae bacterium]